MIQFESIWKTLTFDRKAGYLVWPSLAGSLITDREAELLERFSPWGVSLFARNLKSLSEAKELCTEIRSLTEKGRTENLPQGFLAIDEEGGRVSRLPSPFPKLEPAAWFSDKSDNILRSQCMMQAAVARSLGINMFYAPVCDLLLEPSNKVIGDRSFGSDPETVYAKSKVVYDTLLEFGICPVLKHFPGHGGTKEDTHVVSAVERRTIDDLLQSEFAVFQSYIDSAQDKELLALMTCHVVFESIDPQWPVTLSKQALQSLLREKMGFTGLIMSDDLRMNAIAHCYQVQKTQEVAIGSDELSKLESSNLATRSSEQESYLIDATIRALESGCDVVLACRGIERETVCLEAVSTRLKGNSAFDRLCMLKAQRVHNLALNFNRV